MGSTPESEQQQQQRGTTRGDDNAIKQRQIGAGVAAGVGASLLAGPVVGVIAGLGAAHLTRKDGSAGDVARSLGDVALSAKDKASELDQKYRIVDRSKNVADNAWESVRKLESDNGPLHKGKDAAVKGWENTVEYTRRHRLIERGVDGVGNAIDWTTAKLRKTTQNTTTKENT